MRMLKQSTAVTIKLGPFIDDTDGKTAETALTISQADVRLSKNGGNMAQKAEATACTHDELGMYDCPLGTGDTDTLGILTVNVHEAGALPVKQEYMVLPATAYDGLVAGSGVGVRADVQGWLGTVPVAPDTAGHPKVTLKSGSGIGEVSLSSGAVSLSASGIAAVADGVLDENLSDHTGANSLGARLQPSHSGACQNGGNGTTIVLASGASDQDDYYNGELIFGWVTADRSNFFADYISDYVGATRAATVAGIPVSPDSTYTYVIVPGGTIPGASAPSASDNAAALLNAAVASFSSAGTVGQLFNALRVRIGTAQAGTLTTITLDAGASSQNDLYNRNKVVIVAGTGAGQASQAVDYVGSTKVLTVDPAFVVAPDNTSVFALLPLGIDAVTLGAIGPAVWTTAKSGNQPAGSFGERVDADIVRISGDATAADALESAFDGTGFGFPNCTMPTVTTLNGHTPQTGDAFARLGAPAGASVSADIAAVKTDTAGIATLDAKVDTIDANVDAVLDDTGTTGVAVAAGSKTGYALSSAGVDAILDEAITEPAGVFSWASATLRNIIGWLGARASNREEQTATTLTVKNRAAAANLATATVSDDGTTAVKGSFTSS